MRSMSSIKNATASFLKNLINIIIGVVAQAIFIKTLGNEYLGISGLFSNIISMLAIAELGIGSSVIYHLYEPVAKNDKEQIKSLLKFYKKSYRVIALIVLIIGFLILPFIKYIVGQINIKHSIYLIYILFLINAVASYLLSYKRSILIANQKNYVIDIIHILCIICLNFFQILVLFLTKNYIIYLIIKLLFTIIENIFITIVANRMYPYIKEKNILRLDSEIKNDVFKKIKGLIFHNIGGFIVLGSDNIIISKFLGIVTVGLYSNYCLILNAVSNLLNQIFDSIVANIGNLLIEKNSEKSYSVYKSLLMIDSWIYSYASASILCVIEPFITVWVGKEYILPKLVLIILVINFYIQGMRQTCNSFKVAAGIFYEDRYIPLIESVLNIVFSIIFLKFFGLAGVFMGTIASTMLLFLYSYPKYVYINLFSKSYYEYIKENLYHILIAIISIVPTYIITSKLYINNMYLKIIINLVIAFIIPNLIYYFLMNNTNDFKYTIEILSKNDKIKKILRIFNFRKNLVKKSGK